MKALAAEALVDAKRMRIVWDLRSWIGIRRRGKVVKMVYLFWIPNRAPNTAATMNRAMIWPEFYG